MARSRVAARPLYHPLLLGHRGVRGIRSIPENTSASFDRALTDGCDGFEFDVRLTADGQAVVCHDPECGGLEIAGAAAAQLPMLPRLSEVLRRYGSAFLDIELKVSGLETIVLDLLCDRPRKTYVVSSFLPAVLQALHAADAATPLGLICETKKQLRLWKELPVEYVILHQRLVGRILVGDVHRADKRLLVWTVNSVAQMKRFAELGVDGIISDHPKRLAETLGRKTALPSGATTQELA